MIAGAFWEMAYLRMALTKQLICRRGLAAALILLAAAACAPGTATPTATPIVMTTTPVPLTPSNLRPIQPQRPPRCHAALIIRGRAHWRRLRAIRA